MKDKKELLELREKIKSKKPDFNRQDAHKRKKLDKRWRRPKGLQSKMRLKLRGYRKSISTGYGSPKDIRNFDKSGLKIMLISSIDSLNDINPKEEGVMIASNVGFKKRKEIMQKAKEKGIILLNVKDAEAWVKASEEKLQKKKEKRKQKLNKKTEKKKELEKKSEKKKEEKLTEKLTEEEKKQKEKEEKDKLLTKKQ